MSASQPDITGYQRSMRSALHAHWVFFLIEGILLIVFGALAVMLPTLAALAATLVFGWLFLLSGLFGLVTTFWMRSKPGFWWSLISAALGIVAGLLLLASPVQGLISLTLLLIAFFVIEGVASIMFAFEHRHDLPGRWGWMLASGLIDLVLAAMLFSGLPGTAAWTLGLLVGINMLFGGAALTAMALAARKAA